MNRIQYAVAGRESGNASGKAKKDALRIALAMGFALSYRPSSVQFVRVVQQFLSMPRFFGEKVIFFQYPAVSEALFRVFRRAAGNAVRIALVHDLPSIQGDETPNLRKEAEELNFFQFLIVHNPRMEAYVREIGYRGTIVALGLFDYLHDPALTLPDVLHDGSIAFAGNLSKSRFTGDLEKISSRRFLLYGNADGSDFSSMKNVEYKGLLPSDEIPYRMEGDYGLVWDGDSIDSCTGSKGAYLRYINPHKLSLCVAAGKPVITWKGAAIAEFVRAHDIGITVDSLSELEQIKLERDYERMRRNVMNLKQKVASGFFLERALTTALGQIRPERLTTKR